MDRPEQEEAPDMALHFRLADYGRAFATRERGEELRQALTQCWTAGDDVVVDLDGVSHVSYSFADEFLGKLVAEGRMPLRTVGANARVARIAQRAVERRAGEAVSC